MKTSLAIWIVVVCSLWLSCGDVAQVEESSQPNEALVELQRLYEEAKQKSPEDAVDWAKEDFQRAGDWQYRIVFLADQEAEALASQLDTFGEERWEAFWVDRQGDDLRIFLKRPAKSYLRSIPMGEVGKILAGGE